MDRLRVGVAWPALVVLLSVFTFEARSAAPTAWADDGDSFFESDAPFSAKQVNRSIEKAIAWLRSKQAPDGSWGTIRGKVLYGGGKGEGYGHPAGPTALALYTLLRCRVPADDLQVRKGFEYLKKSGWRQPGGSYETSALLLAVCATAERPKPRTAKGRKTKRSKPKPKLKSSYRHWAQQLVHHLLSKRTARGWRYQVRDPRSSHGGENDLSSTNLAARALYAAHQLGLEVKQKVWEDILSYTLDQQELDGPQHISVHPRTGVRRRTRARGFAYIRDAPEPKLGRACGSMTACGLANIVMARRVLSEGTRQAALWPKRPDAQRVQRAIDDALAWLDRNWSALENPPGHPFTYHVYYVYSLRGALELLGERFIGKHAWYSEMGQGLINRQAKDGSWNTWSTHAPEATLDTCFALLFLKPAKVLPMPFSGNAPDTGRGDPPPLPGK